MTVRLLQIRLGVCVALMLSALLISACGGSSSNAGSASSSSSAKTETGKEVFADSGCAGCHTLAAAGSNGTTGPNLDRLKPSYAAVVKQVTNGGGLMPSFAHSLSKAEIDAVAHFVSSAAHS